MTLYERIDALCKEKGINITTLCQKTGVGRSTMTELKQGRTKGLSMVNLNKIASYFSVSVDYLMGNTDDRNIIIAKPSPAQMSTELMAKTAIYKELEDKIALCKKLEDQIALYKKLGDKIAVYKMARKIPNPFAIMAQSDSGYKKAKKNPSEEGDIDDYYFAAASEIPLLPERQREIILALLEANKKQRELTEKLQQRMGKD